MEGNLFHPEAGLSSELVVGVEKVEEWNLEGFPASMNTYLPKLHLATRLCSFINIAYFLDFTRLKKKFTESISVHCSKYKLTEKC